MSKQSFTTGQVLTAAQVNSLQANDYNQTVSVKTASYVLVAADKGTRIEFNTSGSVTCTVNSGLFDAGDTLVIQNRGAGTATVTAGTATVNTSASLAISQYGQGILYFVDNTSAIFFAGAPGDITGVTTGATSGLTGGVTTGTADLKLNFASKGQLAVGTGSGTTDFLNVGTNGYTLVADSSTATGLAYAAPASGGGMTLLDTLSLNGSASVTSATLSGSYNNLMIYIMDYASASNDQFVYFRFNSDTGGNYGSFSVRFSSSGTNFGPSGGFGGTSLPAMDPNNAGISSTSADNISAITVYNYANNVASGAHKLVNIFNKHTNSTTKGLFNAVGAWENTNAITTVTIFNSNSQNFSAGNAYIYGVK